MTSGPPSSWPGPVGRPAADDDVADDDVAGDVRGAAAEAGAVDVDQTELDVIETALATVEAALDRLADGTYGGCEVCGRAVTDAVLAEDPTTLRCPEHLPLPAPAGGGHATGPGDGRPFAGGDGSSTAGTPGA